eukprot:SAG31_NODE_449_length_15539_cov_21.936658_5_plen_102_part_00
MEEKSEQRESDRQALMEKGNAKRAKQYKEQLAIAGGSIPKRVHKEPEPDDDDPDYVPDGGDDDDYVPDDGGTNDNVADDGGDDDYIPDDGGDDDDSDGGLE